MFILDMLAYTLSNMEWFDH